ncbi:MAG TPA: hypothetical protein VNW92_06000, partial [Polyangiaceae bacterium]|nr:hypothetical protein [Polyangiaceae bacterium]
IALSERTYEVEPAAPFVTVVFIGSEGRELARTKLGASGSASYTLHGDEGYVRARLEGEGGKRAWTPAVRVAN